MAYLEKHIQNKQHVFIKIGLSFLVIISFLRYSVARDYFSYDSIYSYIANGGDRFLYTEPLFYYLLKICSDIGLSYNTFLGIVALFYILVFYFFILKKIPVRYWYIGIFFFIIINANYFSAMGALRQSLAVSFFVIAIHFYNKSIFKVLFFLLIGAMFHRSIWLIIPIVLLTKYLSYRSFYYALIPYIIFLIFPNLLPSLIDSFLNMIGITDAFKSYLYTERGAFSIRNIMKYLLFVIIFIQYIIFINLLKKYPTNYYIKFLLVGLLFHLFISIGLGIISRLLSYFYIFYPIAIWLLLQHYKIKNGIVIFIFFLLFLGNHIKQIMLPEEYAKYYAQYQLIIFKSDAEIAEDKAKYKNEEKELMKKGII
jgi:hypothetical protein